MADEAIVAGIAFQVNAEKYLGGILCCLQRGPLRRAYRAAPGYAFHKTDWITLSARRQQLLNELIIGHVILQRRPQPVGDRLAISVIGDTLVVVKQIVPESDPILSVVLILREKLIHQKRTFLRAAVLLEARQLLRIRKQSDDVEIDSARKNRIGNRLCRRNMVRFIVASHQFIDAAVRRRPERQRKLQRGRARDIDLRSFVDPFANRRDLFRAQRSAAQWHPGAALAEDTPYHETLLAISWNDSRAVGASLNHLCPGAERQSCRRLRS